jgi:hypothetical protein
MPLFALPPTVSHCDRDHDNSWPAYKSAGTMQPPSVRSTILDSGRLADTATAMTGDAGASMPPTGYTQARVYTEVRAADHFVN